MRESSRWESARSRLSCLNRSPSTFINRQYAIIVYATFAAITELGIAVELTAPTFLILLGAVALAAAIAFGIGGREVAQDILQKAYNRSNEVTGSSSAKENRQ